MMKQAFPINVVHFYFLFNWSIYLQINDNVVRNLNINAKTWIKERFIDDGFLLHLTFLFHATFLRNLTQIFKRCKSYSVWKIFFDRICTFGVMIHIVAEKEFFYYAFSYSILNITPEIWLSWSSFFAWCFQPYFLLWIPSLLYLFTL